MVFLVSLLGCLGSPGVKVASDSGPNGDDADSNPLEPPAEPGEGEVNEGAQRVPVVLTGTGFDSSTELTLIDDAGSVACPGSDTFVNAPGTAVARELCVPVWTDYDLGANDRVILASTSGAGTSTPLELIVLGLPELTSFTGALAPQYSSITLSGGSISFDDSNLPRVFRATSLIRLSSVKIGARSGFAGGPGVFSSGGPGATGQGPMLNGATGGGCGGEYNTQGYGGSHAESRGFDVRCGQPYGSPRLSDYTAFAVGSGGGSGGSQGNPDFASGPGGRGGGAIFLSAARIVLEEATIGVDGEDGLPPSSSGCQGGGGAGGSVWLRAYDDIEMTGGAEISAIGGRSPTFPCNVANQFPYAGSDGRVRVDLAQATINNIPSDPSYTRGAALALANGTRVNAAGCSQVGFQLYGIPSYLYVDGELMDSDPFATSVIHELALESQGIHEVCACDGTIAEVGSGLDPELDKHRRCYCIDVACLEN